MNINDLNPKNVDFDKVKNDAQRLANDVQGYAKDNLNPDAIKDTVTDNIEKIVPIALAAYGSISSFYKSQKNKYQSNSSNGTSNALLFVAGAAIGATVGVLLAPAKGTETRQRISGETNKLLKDVETRGKELVNEAQTIINDNVELAKKKYEETRNGKSTVTRKAKSNGRIPTNSVDA